MSDLRVLFQPGHGNSGPEHWQSLWARGMPSAVWVEQRDWLHPVREEWVETLTATALATPGRKVVVAHSLGCLVVAEAAAALREASVLGAFLVAVPDPRGPSFPTDAVGFRPVVHTSMPIPSVMIASTDDPYGPLDHSRRVARHWGSRLVLVGAKGHINASSGLAEWSEGRKLFDSFVATL